ncbi:putative phage protein gp47/JayE [Thalassospira sp. 11-3]|nr:putative phage protein gp47/JayE [Thalassospira sp. 11-3]
MKQIPTTKAIYESIEKDLRAKLDLSDDNLRRVLNALAASVAAQIKLLYLYTLDVQKNIFPDTADTAENGGELERLGRIYLNRDPNPATAGVYKIQLTGESGSVIRPDLTFKSNEDSKSPGNLYVTDAEYILTGANDFIEIRALDGGTEFGLDVSNELTITEPVLGVDQLVQVTEVVEQPKAAETTAAYRQAILNAIQLEPQGGSKTDYRLWAADAQGVRQVYPYIKDSNAGVVQIFVEANPDDSTDGKGTPGAPILTEVEEVLEMDPDETKPTNERGRRPIQSTLEVAAISLVPVDVDITALDTDTTAIRSAIETNLVAYLFNVRPYIAGADLSRNKNDILYSARLQSVVTDVLESSNFFTDFVMSVNGVAVSSYEFSGANIPYLRNLNFV